MRYLSVLFCLILQKSKTVAILTLFLLLIYNYKAFTQSNFFEKTTLGVTAQINLQNLYNSNGRTIKTFATGMLLQHNTTNNFGFKTGLLLSLGRVIDSDGIKLHNNIVIPKYTLDCMFAQIPLILHYFPLSKQEKKVYPVINLGFKTSFLIGGVYSYYTEQNTVEYKEFYSVFREYNNLPEYYYLYGNLIIGSGVYFNLQKVNWYFGVNLKGWQMLNSSHAGMFFSFSGITITNSIYF
jgi:hypothetical protein